MLFLRGLRWRRGFSAAVLVVGIISAAVAAIGPLYARAASESTLTDELRDGAPGTGLAYSLQSTAHMSLPAVEALVGRGLHVPHYGDPIADQSALITAKSAANLGSTPSTLVFRDGECAHVVLTAGHCPTAPGQLLIPANAVTSGPRWQVGQTLTMHEGEDQPDGIADGPALVDQHGRSLPFQVVGAYRARDTTEPYWFALPYFRSTLGPAVASAIKGGADAIFVSARQFAKLPPWLTTVSRVDVPLRPTTVRLKDVPALRQEVTALQHRFPHEGPLLVPALRTDVFHTLAAAARDRRQVQTATLVVVLELAALSLLVLFQVVGGAVEARGDEIALAKLRGLRPRRTILFALGEPVALLLVAAPLGFALALAVTHLLAGTALVGGTPVAVTAATGLALAAAFAGSALAAVLAAIRTVTRPVLEQWRNTSPPRHGARWLLALDLVLAATAVAAVAFLRAGGGSHPRPVFLLAPALIVFAVALVGMRLLPRAGRRGLARTRSSKHIAAFLALRQTVRRPGGLRLATLLAVAAGLATFAVCGEAVALGNRDARAHTELGTARQVAAQYDVGHDPEAAVARVDPDGKWAMAAATWSPDGGPASGNTITGQLMGVQPSRLQSAAYDVRGQLSPAALSRDVTAPVAPPAEFHGTHVHATITSNALAGDRPTVIFNVRPGGGGGVARQLSGRLRLGRADYTADVPCAAGCAFAGVAFERTADAADLVTGSVTVDSITADSGGSAAAVPVRLNNPAAWRSDQIGVGASSRIGVGAAGGLTVAFHTTGGSSAVITYADSPTVLPIVASPKSTTTQSRTGGVSDYSGTAITYRVVRRASPLPLVLDTGAIADLDYLRIRLPDFDLESSWTVWLSPKAPADAVTRLEHAGLIVQHVSTAAARVAELGRQGPALGLLLLLVCAVAAAVLAIGGTAVSLLADARRRSFELAALRVVGVPHRTLRRSAVAEQALLLGAAVLLGLPSGYAAAALVLPVVPEFSDSTPVVLRYSPPVLVALACAAAFAFLLWITALVAGRALARAAVPARLREAAR